MPEYMDGKVLLSLLSKVKNLESSKEPLYVDDTMEKLSKLEQNKVENILRSLGYIS